MKNIAKISLCILIIALYQTAYSSEYDTSQSNSPTGEMFINVDSQPNSKVTSPFGLQHQDHILSIESAPSQESEDFIIYVTDASTQTTPKTIKEEIEDVIQHDCNNQGTDLILTGDINGKHYEVSIFNNQRNLQLQKQENNQIQEDSQKLFDLSEQILNIRLTASRIDELTKELSAFKSDRPKPSRRISHNPNNKTTKTLGYINTPKQNSSYFTTTNCLIASLTVATAMTGYLILKDRK